MILLGHQKINPVRFLCVYAGLFKYFPQFLGVAPLQFFDRVNHFNADIHGRDIFLEMLEAFVKTISHSFKGATVLFFGEDVLVGVPIDDDVVESSKLLLAQFLLGLTRLRR